MDSNSIAIHNILATVSDLWLKKWFLLTSGDMEKNHYNTMTVAWGCFGVMWNKPVVVAAVRPTRYTYEYLEKYDTFTLCSFNEEYRDDMVLLGSKSGRDGDKIAETGVTVVPSRKVAAPSFKQAEVVIECKKIYWDDVTPDNFLDASIEKNYPKKDYHRLYFGEIVEIRGADKYPAESR